MDYRGRAKIIGKRIFAERKKQGWSQNDLLLKIYMSGSSHKSLRSWEKGERLPDLDSLARMAEVFQCDIGYLLGDYEERTRNAADIVRKMGLSTLAAENMDEIKNCSGGDDFWTIIIDYLSFLLENCNTVLIPVAIGVGQCIDAKLEEAHYRKEVLPQFTIPADVAKKIFNDFTFRDDEYTDIQGKRTNVFNRIKQLTDIYASNLYHCEKNVSSVIEKFIIKEIDKYG